MSADQRRLREEGPTHHIRGRVDRSRCLAVELPLVTHNTSDYTAIENLVLLTAAPLL